MAIPAQIAETLPREDPDFDLRLIEPAAVCRGVMQGEAIPNFGGHLGSEHICHRLLATNIEMVQYQVNRVGCRVGQCQGDGNLSEFKARTIGRGEREVPTRLRLYGA